MEKIGGGGESPVKDNSKQTTKKANKYTLDIYTNKSFY